MNDYFHASSDVADWDLPSRARRGLAGTPQLARAERGSTPHPPEGVALPLSNVGGSPRSATALRATTRLALKGARDGWPWPGTAACSVRFIGARFTHTMTPDVCFAYRSLTP